MIVMGTTSSSPSLPLVYNYDVPSSTVYQCLGASQFLCWWWWWYARQGVIIFVNHPQMRRLEKTLNMENDFSVIAWRAWAGFVF